MKPAKKQLSVLKQICELIPRNLVPHLAKKHGIDKQSRAFTPWSHMVSTQVRQNPQNRVLKFTEFR